MDHKKTGGGGGNRTRVRRQIHASLYVRSLRYWSRPPCSPRTGSAEDPPLDFAGDFEALTAGYPPVNDALLKPLKAQATEDELLLVKQPVRLVGRHFLVCHSFYELLAISARNLHSTIPVEPISPPHNREVHCTCYYKQFPRRPATDSPFSAEVGRRQIPGFAVAEGSPFPAFSPAARRVSLYCPTTYKSKYEGAAI